MCSLYFPLNPFECILKEHETLRITEWTLVSLSLALTKFFITSQYLFQILFLSKHKISQEYVRPTLYAFRFHSPAQTLLLIETNMYSYYSYFYILVALICHITYLIHNLYVLYSHINAVMVLSLFWNLLLSSNIISFWDLSMLILAPLVHLLN